MNEKAEERREFLEQKSVVVERQRSSACSLLHTKQMRAAQIGREGWDVTGIVHEGESEG